MKKINENLYPQGGYQFRDADGTRIIAGNWRSVIKKVTDYRNKKGVPLGDVRAEVMAQACAANPNLCHDDTGRETPNIGPTLKAKMLHWMNGFYQRVIGGEKLKYVPVEEARLRIQICAECSLNVKTDINTCGSCKIAAAEYRDKILGPSRPQDARLGGCNGLGIDLRCAVHLDETRVNNPALPQKCWRKTTV